MPCHDTIQYVTRHYNMYRNMLQYVPTRHGICYAMRPRHLTSCHDTTCDTTLRPVTPGPAPSRYYVTTLDRTTCYDILQYVTTYYNMSRRIQIYHDMLQYLTTCSYMPRHAMNIQRPTPSPYVICHGTIQYRVCQDTTHYVTTRYSPSQIITIRRDNHGLSFLSHVTTISLEGNTVR